MAVFVCDVSGYQPNFNFAAADASGFAIKATEGPAGYYTNPSFRAQLSAAQATGKPSIAYHYVRGTNWSSQADAVTAVVPKGVPIALDLEAGGDIPTTRALAAELRRRGVTVPLLYCPRWWWSGSGGSAPIGDIAPLWSSAYPAGGGSSPSTVYANCDGDGGSGWAAYGGGTPVLWQFSSTVSIGGYGSIDTSAFKGTEAQLRSLFGLAPAAPTSKDDDDMPLYVRNSKGDTLCFHDGHMVAAVDGSQPPSGALVWTVGDDEFADFAAKGNEAAAATAALAALPGKLDEVLTVLKALPAGAVQAGDAPITLHGSGTWSVGA